MPIPAHVISRLPPPARLRALIQALATLDAIISPEWEYRYYSFNEHWGAGEAMGSMRNGQGDNLFMLFNTTGAFIKGFDHGRFKPGGSPRDLYARVPPSFSSGVVEPAFSPDWATFCCWRAFQDERWEWASSQPSGKDGDGSDWLLAGLDGSPETYLTFAREYYEIEVDAEAVGLVHRRAPITLALATRLNPEIDFQALQLDLMEIGYPISAD